MKGQSLVGSFFSRQVNINNTGKQKYKFIKKITKNYIIKVN
jgi:hypothetical protein